jgi:hypothetical protein
MLPCKSSRELVAPSRVGEVRSQTSRCFSRADAALHAGHPAAAVAQGGPEYREEAELTCALQQLHQTAAQPQAVDVGQTQQPAKLNAQEQPAALPPEILNGAPHDFMFKLEFWQGSCICYGSSYDVARFLFKLAGP